MDTSVIQLTVSPELEAKFSSGTSFIEDIAEDRFNVICVYRKTNERGVVYKFKGEPAKIAEFIQYLFA